MYLEALDMVQSPKPAEMYGAVHQLGDPGYTHRLGLCLFYLCIGRNNRLLDSGGRHYFHYIRLRHRIQSHPPRLLLHTHISDCNDWCTTVHQTGKNKQPSQGLDWKFCPKEASGEEFFSIHLVFFAVLVYAAALLDRYTGAAFLH